MRTPEATEAVVLRFLHDVLAGAGPSSPADLTSSTLLQQRVTAFQRAFGDVRISPQVLVIGGDRAAVHFSARGIHRGMYWGIPATGRAWTASCGAVFRVADGRIADYWLVWDTASILEQIGALSLSGRRFRD